MAAIIVLADDEPDLRAIYAAALRREGYVVKEAADGREALDLVIQEPPALLILDVWMPRLNGFEVVDRLKLCPAASSVRVVMLSNLGDADSRLEGFAGGVCEYWVKGLSLEDLRDRVGAVLAGESVLPRPS